jgi:hypothetical protein
MTAQFTIRIFVPDGDPEGMCTVDQLNWIGTLIHLSCNLPYKTVTHD